MNLKVIVEAFQELEDKEIYLKNSLGNFEDPSKAIV